MTKEDLRMSEKEAQRLGIMKMLVKKDLTLGRASEELELSLKQTRRIFNRYLEEGTQGLISRKRGQPSGNKIAGKVKKKALKAIGAKYPDFGPTLAREKLREREEIQVSVETVRKWMIEEGIWKSKRKREVKIYQRRTRRSRFGEMLQGDGSPHDWFEGRGEKCTLLQFVDDATSKTTVARFVPVETTEGYLQLLGEHVERYGRPQALYVDKHSVFRVNRDEIQKGVGITHFGQVVKKLGIELICANSPQAKGRVERKNGVFQDRLIKEMRLRKISRMEEVNAFLPEFLEEMNRRFGKEPASPEDAHRPLRAEDDFKKIFARRDRRKLSKDLTFQHHGTLYLIETKSPNRMRHGYVDVIWREGETIEVEYQGIKLNYKRWSEKAYEQPPILNSKEIAWTNKRSIKPGRDHPWR